MLPYKLYTLYFTEKLLSKMTSFANTITKSSGLKRSPFTVLIEGNIGSGKTTFLNHFSKFDNICLLTEPVEQWRNLKGNNLLASILIHNAYSVYLLMYHETN